MQQSKESVIRTISYPNTKAPIVARTTLDNFSTTPPHS